MLSHKSVLKLRYEIIREIINYKGDEHIKLNIDDELLDKIIFDKKSDHKELAIPMELLKVIDLGRVSWNDVNIQGLDFSGTINVELCAQRVYKKSLYNTILKDASLNNHFTEFEGICIKGTNFEGVEKVFSSNLINPQLVVDKDMSDTKLKGMILTSNLDGVRVVGTNFTGAKSNVYDSKQIHLNPQTVKDKDLTETVLNGVIINGPITNECKILGTNFTGSNGGVLYYDSEEELEYYRNHGTILNDLEFICEYDNTLDNIKESFKVMKKTI